jgi:hypothetical protein
MAEAGGRSEEKRCQKEEEARKKKRRNKVATGNNTCVSRQWPDSSGCHCSTCIKSIFLARDGLCAGCFQTGGVANLRSD